MIEKKIRLHNRNGYLIARSGLFAGIAGGALFDLYLWITNGLSPRVFSTVMGNAVSANPRFELSALAIHFAVGIVWAGAYAYFVSTRPTTNQHWAAAGASYGILVYVLMQLIFFTGGALRTPATPTIFVNLVIAHVVFFGLPIAYVVKRTLELAQA